MRAQRNRDSLLSPRNTASRRGGCGVAGWARQGTLETCIEVDDSGCFEDAVALPPDIALVQHSSVFESVDGLAGSNCGAPDQLRGALDGDDRHTRQYVEEEFDGRVGTDPPEPLPPCGIERVAPRCVDLGVTARPARRRGERAQPVAGTP